MVLAMVLPPLTVVVIATQDLLSAVIVLLTLPLVPVFGALVGLATRDRAEQQWREMSSLAGHFLDVVRGLPTLVAHRRARAQSARIGEITDRYRLASLRTLRLAFASSAVLELVATLSVALVAVTVGVRLASGSMELGPALLVLLLAPEAYWPLRRVGAEFHAAAEGVATFESVQDLLDADGSHDPGAAPAGSPLVVTDLVVGYPDRSTPALDGVSTLVPARGVTVVTGPSGCGKSTLLAAIAGLVAPSSGSITVAGGRSPVTPGSPRWPGCPSAPASSPGPSPTTCGSPIRPPPTHDSGRCWPGSRWRNGSERWSWGWTHRSARTGHRSPPASEPGWRWHGSSSPTDRGCCSTSPRPTSTSSPNGSSPTRSRTSAGDGAVVVVAHRPAMVALADTVVARSTGRARQPSPDRAPDPRPPAARQPAAPDRPPGRSTDRARRGSASAP